MIFIVFSESLLGTKAKNDKVLLAFVRESQEAIHTDETFPEKHFNHSEVLAD